MSEKVFSQLSRIRKIRLEKAERIYQSSVKEVEEATERKRLLERKIESFSLSIPEKKKVLYDEMLESAVNKRALDSYNIRIQSIETTLKSLQDEVSLADEKLNEAQDLLKSSQSSLFKERKHSEKIGIASDEWRKLNERQVEIGEDD